METDVEEEFGGASTLDPYNKRDKDNDGAWIIRELSSRKVLEQLRMNLKGYFFDWDTKKYKKIEGFEPLMNDKGISKYLSIISSVVSDVTTFSNYSADEIPQLALYVCDKAIPTIHINYKDYGIKNKSDLQIIDIQILSLTLGALKKALGAGDRGVIGRTIQENIMNRQGLGNLNNLAKEERGGFLSKLNPFR